MRGIAVHSGQHILKYAFIFGIIFILVSGIADTGSVAHANVTHVGSQDTSRFIATSCPSAIAPTSQSLLVVLLDRSGSLILEPGATDPNGYSTSVTKALADLWPGDMAVIPFTGNSTQLPIFGPYTLSDPTQQAELKNKIQNYPIEGNTPLAPAMHEAFDLLHQHGDPAGSRVIIITDGNPTGVGNNDGPHQEQDIRQNLIKQYCDQGIRVNAFGLTIDTTTPDGVDAAHLLSDITSGTDGAYASVRKPEELAKAVIQLYAQWLNLSFIEATVQNGNAPVGVDSSAKEVTILTFRSDNSTSVTLDGPDNQPIQGVQAAEDRHYVIDNLTSGSNVLVPGTYTIHTSNDPDVQVYELVKSTLVIDIIAPTAEQKFPNNKAVVIEAKFVDNGIDKQPRQGEAVMYAIIQFTANGIQESSVKIPLIQNGTIFKGQTEVYGQAGLLNIEVQGNDQGIQRSKSIEAQLVVPPPLPPPPCKLGFWGCSLQQVQKFWSQHQSQIVLSALGVLLLLLLLFWLSRPSPFGALKRGSRGTLVPLGQGRTLGRRLFKKSIISSDELEDVFPEFAAANFDLIFQRSRIVSLKSKSETPIKTKPGKGSSYAEVKSYDKNGVPLSEGSVIYISGRDVAIFTEADE